MPFTVCLRIALLLGLILSCNTLWAKVAPEDELSFVHWMGQESVDTNSVNSVNAVMKDAQGFMWFGGESGLIRFNGVSLEPFPSLPQDPTSLSSNHIWDMLVDHQSILWIASEDGLNRFNADTENFTRFQTKNANLSSDYLNSLSEDAEGNLWIGSNQGLDKLDKLRQKVERQEAFAGINVRKVMAANGDILWIGTREKGLARYNTRDKSISWFQFDPANRMSLPHNGVNALVMDNQQNVWVGTLGGGVARFDSQTGNFRRYIQLDNQPPTLGSNIIWDIHIDQDGILWVASETGGVSRYDPVRDQFVASTTDPMRKNSLAFPKVRRLYSDELGDLWLGLFPRGVDHLSQFAQQFHNYREQSNDRGLTNTSVLSFLPDKSGNLWIGTERGLNFFNTRTQRISHYWPDKNNSKAMQGDAVLSLAQGDDNSIWLSIWGVGLHIFDIGKNEFTFIKPQPDSEDGLHTSYIWSLLRDQEDRLFAGGESGGLHQYLGQQKFKRFEPNIEKSTAISFDHIRSLFQTSEGRIWVGTYNGLDEFIPSSQTFAHHLRDQQGNSRFGKVVSDLFEDNRHNLWVATQDGGVTQYNTITREAKNYSIEQGLISNFVSSIQQDNAGFIWVSTSKGLARINPENDTLTNIDKSNGVVGNNFNRRAAFKDADGKLYFGGADGLTIFDPITLFDYSAPAPKVVIQSLRLLNVKASIGEKDSVLTKSISRSEAIELAHQHTMVAFDFYALSFRAPHLNQYAYKLEGFDKDWNYIGNNHTATYTNLPAGEYVFKVKAANSLGVWNDQGTQIKVNMLPAPWLSGWAYAGYLLLLATIGYFIFADQKKRMAFKQERALNTKLMNLDKLKDSFLANTSHELRTPLNGIIGLAEALQEGSQGEINEGMRHTLRMISNSGRRLSYLINDILDFSKLSKRNLDLNLKSLAVAPLVDMVFDLTKPLIGDKSLHLVNLIDADTPAVLADVNRLQQILINLIGNAIKFTQRGAITLSANVVNDFLVISIFDTGIGIAEDDRDKLFVEFSQLDNSDTREQGGTGLGLAICKQLVRLHGGELGVKSTLGLGSEFYFSLPLSNRPAESADIGIALNSGDLHIHKVVETTDTNKENSNKLLLPADILGRYTILVVDDDAINRMVLISILKLHNHHVLEANSGQKALDILRNNKDIDLVILDVMMPGMNGYETAMRIRVNYQVHHLPILFLTAKNFSDDLVRGFVAGGNDFLTKPVSKHELLTRVTSHLRLLEINRNLENVIRNRSAEYVATQYELQALDKIVSSLNQEMNPDVLLKTLLNQMLLLVNTANGASLWQFDSSSMLVCSAALALEHNRMGEQCFKVTSDFIAALRALSRDGKPIYPLRDFLDSPLRQLYELFEQPENTLITVASYHDEVIGFIALTHDVEPPAVNEAIIAALNRIKFHTISVVMKAKMMRDK